MHIHDCVQSLMHACRQAQKLHGYMILPAQAHNGVLANGASCMQGYKSMYTTCGHEDSLRWALAAVIAFSHNEKCWGFLLAFSKFREFDLG